MGIIYHPDFLSHEAIGSHPERPERVSAIMEHLSRTGLLTKLRQISFRPAEEEWLRRVHDPEYIQFVKTACQNERTLLDSGDTYCNQNTYQVARLAVGGCLRAADMIVAGEIKRCFCCVRPPGHHAGRNRAMGFCIFNNIAILARYLQHRYQIERIAIVDWDVHHGNGTQHVFYDTSGVFYFSIHQFPHYPGTGEESDVGTGAGKGFTLNVPLPAGCGDSQYLQAFREKLLPVMEKFQPEIILISAGFDAHMDDPLSAMRVTEEGFAAFTSILRDLAQTYCSDRMISVLEGGYHLHSLVESVQRHLEIIIQE